MSKAEKLVLYFDDDDGDGTGKLFAEASSSGFSGVGKAWFDKIQLINTKRLESLSLKRTFKNFVFWAKIKP